MRVYDIASIGNKGVSQRIISAPFSPLGHDTHIPSKNATCVALPTNQAINPKRNEGDLMRITNQEQPFLPIYLSYNDLLAQDLYLLDDPSVLRHRRLGLLVNHASATSRYVPAADAPLL